jgi:serine/threonine-protein kinase SRPK3
MGTTMTSEIIRSDVLIEEERVSGYDAKQFYPISLGDILHGRYKILAKLGCGSSSTVWLAKDTSRYNLAQFCTSYR